MRKYITERIREIVKLDDTPHKLALASAIGVFIAFSPWLGLHIVSGFFFAWIFRVSKFVVLSVMFVNNPWTMVPICAFNLWLGVRLTGSDITIPEIAWSEIGFRELFTILKPLLWPFVLGSLAAGAVAGVLAYFLFHWAVTRYRKAEAV
jgi:uncharacterized protein (DUF2062 family)